jgi:hypothetical protein
MVVSAPVQVLLKVKTDSKFYEFLDWYETFYTTINPETGRKRKGNFRKFLIEEIEFLISSGKVNELIKVVEEFKKARVLSPELQAAKQNLNETDFAKLVELMEKAKVGA